jgi:hypothetical protein
MTKFNAVAQNEDGLTFVFSFYNANWNGVVDAAVAILNDLVANDNLHRATGPWTVVDVDLG